MRRLPLLPVLLVPVLLLPACTGDGGGSGQEESRALPAPSVSGACGPLQPQLERFAELVPSVPESGALPEDVATGFQDVQSGLSAGTVSAPEPVVQAVEVLVGRIGVLRVASEAERLEAAQAQDLREGYEGVLEACAQS